MYEEMKFNETKSLQLKTPFPLENPGSGFRLESEKPGITVLSFLDARERTVKIHFINSAFAISGIRPSKYEGRGAFFTEIMNSERLRELDPKYRNLHHYIICTGQNDFCEIVAERYEFSYQVSQGLDSGKARSAEKLCQQDGTGYFTGKLGTLKLVDVIQLINHTNQSGLLNICDSKGRKANLLFLGGGIVEAHYLTLKQEAAFFAMVAIQDGTFDFMRGRQEPPDDPIQKNTHLLLFEACQLMDEKKTIRPQQIERLRWQRIRQTAYSSAVDAVCRMSSSRARSSGVSFSFFQRADETSVCTGCFSRMKTTPTCGSWSRSAGATATPRPAATNPSSSESPRALAMTSGAMAAC